MADKQKCVHQNSDSNEISHHSSPGNLSIMRNPLVKLKNEGPAIPFLPSLGATFSCGAAKRQHNQKSSRPSK